MWIVQWKHELKLLAADRLVFGLAAVLAGLIAYGLYNGMSWTRFQERAIASARTEENEAIVASKRQAERVRKGEEQVSYWNSPIDVRGFTWAHLVRYAAKPPAPLAPLAVGQSDLYPYLVKLNINAKAGFADAYETVNPRKLLLGPFDPAFVIVYLLPLFVLALSHDLLASEKEAGILGLLAAQPVSLRRLLSFKIGFRLGLLLLLTAGLLLIAVAVAGIDPRQPGVGWRLVSWFGIVFAYCGFWFALAMLVVSLGWRSATNAAVLAASWLTVVILVPAGVNMFLAAAYPMPNRMDYIVRLRDAADDIRKATDEIAEGFFADHPELRPDAESADDESKWVLGQLELDRRMQAAVAEFTDALQHQQDLAERLKFFSPALLTQSAFLELTGTGLARHRQFLAQIDAYHAELRDFFNPKLIRGDFAFDAFDDIPRFEYREESAGDLAGRVGTDLLGLAAPALLMGWLASIAVRRYRVAGS